jgi:hypothetical protein
MDAPIPPGVHPGGICDRAVSMGSTNIEMLNSPVTKAEMPDLYIEWGLHIVVIFSKGFDFAFT